MSPVPLQIKDVASAQAPTNIAIVKYWGKDMARGPNTPINDSASLTLDPGDLLLTGTPAGVGPVVAGDRITAGATGFVEMAVDVVAEGGGA